MSKHKSEDYKISAVKYYLNNDVSLDDICEKKVNVIVALLLLFVLYYMIIYLFFYILIGQMLSPVSEDIQSRK